MENYITLKSLFSDCHKDWTLDELDQAVNVAVELCKGTLTGVVGIASMLNRYTGKLTEDTIFYQMVLDKLGYMKIDDYKTSKPGSDERVTPTMYDRQQGIKIRLRQDANKYWYNEIYVRKVDIDEILRKVD